MENHQSIKIIRLCSIELLSMCREMGRITITLNDRDHLALKLLALQRNEKIVILLQEAMRKYLDAEGAYELAIRKTENQSSENDNE